MTEPEQRNAIEELLNKASGQIEDCDAFTTRQAETNTTAMNIDEVHVEDFKIGPNSVTGTATYVASGEQIEDMADAGWRYGAGGHRRS
jgi:hypothetical protein